MSQLGFMACGATTPPAEKPLGSGLMTCGAMEQKSKVENEIAEVKTKPIESLDNAEKLVSGESFQAMHVLTLKKLAIEKGYTGTIFTKKVLIEFLTATPNV